MLHLDSTLDDTTEVWPGKQVEASYIILSLNTEKETYFLFYQNTKHSHKSEYIS